MDYSNTQAGSDAGLFHVSDEFELVELKNGAFSVRSRADSETFHPVAGPIEEAEALYVRQLRLKERSEFAKSLVIWDVGLGAGGNALTTILALAGIPAVVQIHSFDHTLGAFRFAREHGAALRFPVGFEEAMDELLQRHSAEFSHRELKVRWTIHAGDFPSLLAGATPVPAPDAVFFDAFSPRANPEMWTLPVFENLFRRLSPERPCTLATFSRSTMARTALLLAGFFVGAGEAVAGKEETTVAANRLELLQAPLGTRWLHRAQVSQSAEPLRTGAYTQARLSSETWRRLRAHPQFATALGEP